MNIVTDIDNYKEEAVYFCDPIQNNVMNNSLFIRIYYSMKNFTLNGIYLRVPLHNVSIEKYFNKYKCIFDVSFDQEIIMKIKQMEEELLKKISDSLSWNETKMEKRIPQYKIYEQLKQSSIKVFQSTNHYYDSSNLQTNVPLTNSFSYYKQDGFYSKKKESETSWLSSKISSSLLSSITPSITETNINSTIQKEQIFILKISGIWVTEEYYGATYKFVLQ